ncbi:MAG TPA: ABC transporter ATP-binding protein [Candidatus Dormibacteraeota bacterium]|nr:ABC transporter ATP-binding protein [Candidatus Dormibacteraeota bacterium]
MYELTGVSKRFSKGRQQITALEGVDLTIGKGEFLAVQGPTGHGKTTLLQLLGGLDRPTAGRLSFEGQDLATMREGALARLRSRAFGFVFQTFNLIPTLTAQENVETALAPLRVRPAERRRRALQALADTGLADRARHLPLELSGGQQQRVAIARALVGDPEVILADEPTGNLDENMRDDIMELLLGIWRDRHPTLVIVTHDSGIARRAQRRIWIREGRVNGSDDPAPVQAPSAPTASGSAAVGDGRGPGLEQEPVR